ncbi:MAG: F0F1 ATP synthase subunit epsilon [Phycisphaerales bacterium]|nr:F0F1 ATP synthase subunit epsilon [Phycisphaerales bacterium]
MAKTFRVKLVTPAASLLDDSVESATVPLWDGLMGFMPGRAPILGKLGCGELQLTFGTDAKTKAEGGSTSYFVDGGVVRMAEGQLTILAERAAPVRELVASDAEAQLAKANNDRIAFDDPNRDAKNQRREREIKAAKEKIRLARGSKAV